VEEVQEENSLSSFEEAAYEALREKLAGLAAQHAQACEGASDTLCPGLYVDAGLITSEDFAMVSQNPVDASCRH
jgi:hypothetical protein